MDSTPELDEKILAWAKGQPKYARFMKNMVLLREMFLKHHISKSVEDIIVGGNADLELMIVKDYDRKAVTLCSGCMRKVCTCGKEDGKEFQGYAYLGTDVTYQGSNTEKANITVSISPFNKKVMPLEVDKIYRIEGFVKDNSYNGKRRIEFLPNKVTEVEDVYSEPTPSNVAEAKKEIDAAMNMFGGKIAPEAWSAVTGKYDAETITKVCTAYITEDADGNKVVVQSEDKF